MNYFLWTSAQIKKKLDSEPENQKSFINLC